ncbi:MAG: hypothetical protein IPP96_08520 [Chitinophagaceae bacterium]|nr:hypothetical protein [Chitinophagaceae bacterium]
MKHFAAIAIMLLFTFLATTGYSQTVSKPKQFSNFPDVINCAETELSNIFNATPGQNISLSFSDNFSFSGDVVNSVVKYSNLQSAVIKSPAFHNSIFSVSRITNKDNSVSYVGRIINKNYFDAYELKKNAAGNYQLIKVETDRVIPDCTQQ